MNHSGGHQLSHAELDQLTAEVLPRRLALSTGVAGPAPAHYAVDPAPAHYAAGPTPAHYAAGSAPALYAAGPSTEVYYACQVTQSHGTPGLLNTGLFAQAAYSTTTCVPGVAHAR